MGLHKPFICSFGFIRLLQYQVIPLKGGEEIQYYMTDQSKEECVEIPLKYIYKCRQTNRISLDGPLTFSCILIFID